MIPQETLSESDCLGIMDKWEGKARLLERIEGKNTPPACAYRDCIQDMRDALYGASELAVMVQRKNKL